MPDIHSRTSTHRRLQRQPVRGILQLPPLLSIVAIAGVGLLLLVLFPLDWLRRPEVSLITEQSLLSPGNVDGAFDQVSFFYNLSEQATVGVHVLNAAGQTVRTLVRDQQQPAGQHAATWDGRDEGGNVVLDGRYTLVVRAAGAVQSSEQSTTVTIDNTPPLLTIANFQTSQTTRSTTFTIEGTTATDATVWINADPLPVLVDANGVFRSTRQLVEGSNTITVQAVDAAGNKTQAQAEVIVRTTPPILALTSPEADSWLKSNVITVAGTVLPDVKVTINDQPATVNANGEFSLDVVLQDGDNVIRIAATDAVGNITTEQRIVHIRTRGPALALANVPDGLTVSDPSVRVSGQVDPGSTLTVNGNITPVDNRGLFNTTAALRNGTNLITFSATDRAGNTTTLQRSIVYQAASPSSNTLTNLLTGETALRLLATAGLLIVLWILFAGRVRPLHVELALNRSTFYPNQPGDARTLGIGIDLSRDARVTLAVYDQMDRHVMTLCENRPYSKGENQRLWDGQDTSGRLLPDGIYQIEATAHSTFGEATNAVWVNLDTSPAIVSRTRSERLYNYIPTGDDTGD